MAKRPAAELSLSLVDVVTNGLASILVLFFLLTLLREHVTWQSTLSDVEGNSTQATDPLLIVVNAPPGAVLFPTADSPWSDEPSGADIHASHGRNFATFFSGRSLLSPQQVVLTLPVGHSGCEVQVIQGEHRQRTFIPPGSEPQQLLWPPQRQNATGVAPTEETRP